MRTAALLVALLLAGCLGSGAAIKISHDGLATADKRVSAPCEAGAELRIREASIEQGTVRIEVTDGDGGIRYDRTFAPGDSGETLPLTGAAGDWTLTLEGRFSGTVSAMLRCD